MKITSAEFIKGAVGADKILEDKTPKVAFIGRSNVGKSSVINSLTGKKDLARPSSFPGRTQEMNLFLINRSLYFVDLPGYGFTKASLEVRDRLEAMICWYLFESKYEQKKVVLIIDAKTGPSKDDMDMVRSLKEHKKHIVIVANKVDKVKSSERKSRLEKIKRSVDVEKFIPYSAEKNVGVGELINELLSE